MKSSTSSASLFRRFSLLLAFALAASISAVPLHARPCMPHHGRAVSVTATIWGAVDYSVGAWVGHALVIFGDDEPITATFIDQNTSINAKEDGSIEGTETITFSFADGSTFQVLGKFVGTPASTPRLYYLHEVGAIANGTGTYEKVSGSVAIRGPFLFPFPPLAEGEGQPPWLAEMHGAIQGMSTK